MRLLIISSFLLIGCARPGPLPPRQHTTMLRGDRDSSKVRRTSAARPKVEPLAAAPLEEPDRIAVEEAIVRTEHRESHSGSSLELEEFSHPACAALPKDERRACPLTSVPWTGVRDVEGGVELVGFNLQVDTARLRWRFLCHIAFAKSHGSGGGCPLGTPQLRVSVIRLGNETTAALVSSDPAQVSELRRRVRLLVSPR